MGRTTKPRYGPRRKQSRPAAVNENARNTMRANRGSNTGPELALRGALRRAGLIGYRVNFKGVVGSPDIAFTRYKLAVMVQGCFWHRCPHCDPPLPKQHRAFWRNKFAENIARDERTARAQASAGWKTLEIWECQIESDAAACVTKVQRELAAIRDEA